MDIAILISSIIIIICILTLIFSCYQAYTSYNNAEYYKEQAVYFQQLRNNASKLLGEYEDLIFELSGIYGSYLYSEYSYYEDLYYVQFLLLSHLYFA